MTEMTMDLSTQIQFVVGEAIDTYVEAKPTRNRRWTAAEDRFLEENLGFLTEAEIGLELGRTESAVRIRWKRELRLPPPSKHPDYFTARGVARMLGVDEHKASSWVDRGLLPGHEMAGERLIRRVRRLDLDLFAVNPRNWIWFDHRAVPDRRLRRLIDLAEQRWGDEWWNTNQAAEYCGLANNKSVVMAIRRGALPGVAAENIGGRHADPSWTNWFVLRSEVQAWQHNRLHAEDDRNRFILLAMAVGLLPARAARLTGLCRDYYVAQKARALIAEGPVAQLVGDIPGLSWRESDLQIWIDWRRLPGRFPSLEGAIQRCTAGAGRRDDWFALRGLVRNWSAWFLGPDDPLTRSLTGGGRGVPKLVRKVLRKLAARGINVLDELPPRPEKRAV